MASGCVCQNMAPDDLELAGKCLGQLWIFENLSGEERAFLAKNALRSIYEPGQIIFLQGDPADKLFLIKGGRVRLSKNLEDGTEILLDIRKAGDFVGEYMLSERDSLFPVTASAMEKTLICGFTQGMFDRLIHENPSIGLQVIKRLSEQVSSLTTRVGSMTLSSLEDRLYNVLVNVANEHGQEDSRGRVISFPITHEDLSFLVGAHRVSITRAMKALKQSGKIKKSGRSLILPHEPLSEEG